MAVERTRRRRKGESRDKDVQAIVTRALQQAADYIDEEVSPDRAKAARYYAGEPFGNEEEGRSQVVSHDVRDTVHAILPSLMRIFFGAEKPVEFVPEGPEDEPLAEQATDYINYVLTRDNPGFLTLYSAFKDALIRRTGFIKAWWDDSTEVTYESYEGIDDDTLLLLEQDDEIEIIEQESYEDEAARAEIEAQLQEALALAEAAQAQGQVVPAEAIPQPPEQWPMLHDVTVRRRRQRGRIRVEAVPPEEILISRGARSFEDAAVVAHRTEKTVSDLIAMGYDPAELEDIASSDGLDINEESLDRHPEAYGADDEAEGDPSQRKVLYTEAWMHLDIDGDGIAELRKLCCLGDGFKIMRNEPASYVPIVDLCPDPEPHRAIGRSIFDLVHDIQLIKSSILRNMLDSLAQSIHPRTGVVEGMVNMDDVLNNEVGGVIRMRQPGMVQPYTTPFVGAAAFPMIEYMDRLREQRTGITDASQGLDAEVLQSTTKAAVMATVSAAQQQIELIARIFAETGIRRLYRLLLKLVCQYQDKPRTIRLRGGWVTMDPRSWNAGMDAIPSLAIGGGTPEERLATLAAIAERQEMLLERLGPNNPLVSLGQYSRTLSRMVQLAGFKDASQYFNELPLDFQMPEPEPQPSPEMLLAEVQREEIQANIQKKAAELELRRQEQQFEAQLKREQMLRADDRERDRLEADVLLRAADIQAKHGVPVDVGRILALIQRDRSVEGTF